MKRNPYFDNLKFCLIVLVVLAHGMEFMHGRFIDTLYRVIYLFHMPVFVLVAGYFTKQTKVIHIGNLFLQYIIFQTLYVLFHNQIRPLGTKAVTLNYTTPYWLLWFSLALLVWKLIVPYAGRLPLPYGVAAAVLFALLAGNFSDIGYKMSLMRMCVFFPFFLLGYHLQDKHFAAIQKIPRPVALVVFAVSFWLMWQLETPAKLLYGSHSYTNLGYTLLKGSMYRLFVLAWGLLLAFCFMACVPRGHKSWTHLGTHTMQVYYLHGFALQWLEPTAPGWLNGFWGYRLLFLGVLFLFVIALSSGIVALISRPLINPVGLAKKLTTLKKPPKTLHPQ